MLSKRDNIKINKTTEYDFIKLYDQFLKYSTNGKRLQKNGKRIRSSSLKPYKDLRKLLIDFSDKKQFKLRFCSVARLKKRELVAEKKYWTEFYNSFTDYLYNECDCYDNYVGSNIKKIRTFFNYLNNELELNIGNFHKSFYVFTEEIQILTLSPEQLNFLIYNKEFEESLPEHLQRTKDIFVFGCTVALRISDLFKLTKDNIERSNGKFYLKVISQKTNTYTSVLLPDYALTIIDKYKNYRKNIFPVISNARLNLNIKSLFELTPWTDTFVKTRQRRGISIPVYKNKKTKEPYRFCDLITSHTMRRTAITTLLCLNMSEKAVRKISGHAPNSKEFYRYVELSQEYMDNETEKAFDLLKSKKSIEK
ncbi:MAG: tyrosine-type recombinase/integrase [Bacteroidia bacterium]|nr:tyrosine-type recombinase/integrase [Bacteroidia bacterium]